MVLASRLCCSTACTAQSFSPSDCAAGGKRPCKGDQDRTRVRCARRAYLRRSTLWCEDPPLLAGCGTSAGDPSGDGVDRSPADHGLGYGGITFVVTGQAAVRGDPGQRPLDRPPARVDGEPALVGGLSRAHPSDLVGGRALQRHSPRPGTGIGSRQAADRHVVTAADPPRRLRGPAQVEPQHAVAGLAPISAILR